MKYIKQYEKITHTDKYIVWDLSTPNNIIMFILEVIEPLTIYNNQLTSIYIYKYDNEKGLTPLSKNSKCHLEDYEVEKEVIYQSDNLQDCINYINLKSSQNKFNL